MDFIIDAAIQYLSEHNISEKQLREQLYNDFKGLTDLEPLINLAIAHLKKLQLINDFRIAESLTYRFSQKGDHFIRQLLEQKGISEEIITKTLASLEEETTRALQEARKKWYLIRNNKSKDTKAILHRFLTGRAFSPRTIKSTLLKLTLEGYLDKEKLKQKSYTTTDKFISPDRGKYNPRLSS